MPRRCPSLPDTPLQLAPVSTNEALTVAEHFDELSNPVDDPFVPSTAVTVRPADTPQLLSAPIGLRLCDLRS